MAKKDKRFVFNKDEATALAMGANAQIVVDQKTGINYLFVSSGYAGGLTVLLDREGKPVVTTVTTLD